MLSLVIPMAGDAVRFGCKFKPFLKLGDMTFIEHAVEPFYRWSHLIDKVYFVYRSDQEKEYSVSDYLKANIDSCLDVVPVVIEEATSGPRDTAYEAISRFNIKNGIVCDCDHKIDVDNLFKKIIETHYNETVIPVWSIKEHESANWSKIVCDDVGVIDIVEKQEVDFKNYNVWGILGCIYFANLEHFANVSGHYVSDVCKHIFESGGRISFCEARDAYFFGDPEMLSACVEKRRQECSIFCDIDGVLLSHNDHSSNDPAANVSLTENINTINRLKDHNHKIILTTARSEKYADDLKSLLSFYNIKYDHLICGLVAGPRILINDRKPSKPFTQQANAVECYRNGRLDLNIKEILDSNSEVVLEDMSENSGAKTFLIFDGDKKFVRKIINKQSPESLKHKSILKRQSLDLQRFNLYSEGISPKVLQEVENSLEFFIDMEFLDGYKKLSLFDRQTRKNVLKRAMHNIKNNIYCYSKQLSQEEAKGRFSSFLQEKILNKLDNFSLISDQFNSLINGDFVFINGEKYRTLRSLFTDEAIYGYAPKTLSPVHGDLTLENILYNADEDKYSLIDMDGSKFVDTKMLDLGKLAQSILARYNEWKELEPDIKYQAGEFTCDPRWFSYLDKDAQFLQDVWPYDGECLHDAIFYMSTYFVRFTPFRISKGLDHGLFSIMMAVVWLNKLNFWRKK